MDVIKKLSRIYYTVQYCIMTGYDSTTLTIVVKAVPDFSAFESAGFGACWNFKAIWCSVFDENYNGALHYIIHVHVV